MPETPDPPQLVVLRDSGTLPPIFCVHPTGGHVNEYIPLGDLLPDQPLYAIASRARGGAEPEHGSIETMALAYAGLIRGAQPAGPYRLLGWSLGALTAHATACALERSGATVDLVAMIDPQLAAALPRDAAEDAPLAVGMAIQIFHPSPPPGRTIRRQLRALAQASIDDAAVSLTWCEDQRLLPKGSVSAAAFAGTVRLFYAHRALLSGHRPSVCAAPIMLWRTDPRYDGGAHDWSIHTTGRLSTAVVPGATHFTIMRSPYVEVIAAALRQPGVEGR